MTTGVGGGKGGRSSGGFVASGMGSAIGGGGGAFGSATVGTGGRGNHASYTAHGVPEATTWEHRHPEGQRIRHKIGEVCEVNGRVESVEETKPTERPAVATEGRNPTAMTVTRDLVDYHHRTLADRAEAMSWSATLAQWPGLRHLIDKAVKVRERVADSDHTPGSVRPEVTYEAATSSVTVTKLEDEGSADPAYSTGRVDFAEMLHTDAQWSLKHQFDDALGRPYLSTQLAAMLPADVALRLVVRIREVVAHARRDEVATIEAAMRDVTDSTMARLQNEADSKLKELRDERYKPTRLG